MYREKERGRAGRRVDGGQGGGFGSGQRDVCARGLLPSGRPPRAEPRPYRTARPGTMRARYCNGREIRGEHQSRKASRGAAAGIGKGTGQSRLGLPTAASALLSRTQSKAPGLPTLATNREAIFLQYERKKRPTGHLGQSRDRLIIASSLSTARLPPETGCLDMPPTTRVASGHDAPHA